MHLLHLLSVRDVGLHPVEVIIIYLVLLGQLLIIVERNTHVVTILTSAAGLCQVANRSEQPTKSTSSPLPSSQD